MKNIAITIFALGVFLNACGDDKSNKKSSSVPPEKEDKLSRVEAADNPPTLVDPTPTIIETVIPPPPALTCIPGPESRCDAPVENTVVTLADYTEIFQKVSEVETKGETSVLGNDASGTFKRLIHGYTSYKFDLKSKDLSSVLVKGIEVDSSNLSEDAKGWTVTYETKDDLTSVTIKRSEEGLKNRIPRVGSPDLDFHIDVQLKDGSEKSVRIAMTSAKQSDYYTVNAVGLKKLFTTSSNIEGTQDVKVYGSRVLEDGTVVLRYEVRGNPLSNAQYDYTSLESLHYQSAFTVNSGLELNIISTKFSLKPSSDSVLGKLFYESQRSGSSFSWNMAWVPFANEAVVSSEGDRTGEGELAKLIRDETFLSELSYVSDFGQETKSDVKVHLTSRSLQDDLKIKSLGNGRYEIVNNAPYQLAPLNYWVGFKCGDEYKAKYFDPMATEGVFYGPKKGEPGFTFDSRKLQAEFATCTKGWKLNAVGVNEIVGGTPKHYAEFTF